MDSTKTIEPEELAVLEKITANGWQLELWWPEGKEPFPLRGVVLTLDAEKFWASFQEKIAADPREDYQIMISAGWEVYGPYTMKEIMNLGNKD